ncbi:MAG: hypothetical protein WBG91_09845, partial [Syntrophobacteria bacterium]
LTVVWMMPRWEDTPGISKSWTKIYSGNTVKIVSFFGVQGKQKFQTPSTKLQTNIKFQYRMTKTVFEFWSLLFV